MQTIKRFSRSSKRKDSLPSIVHLRALPKNKALIKYLSEEGIKAGMLKTEEYYMANNNREMPKAIEPLYFVTDEKLNYRDLTDKGTAWLAAQVKDDQLFVLPDITTELSALEKQKMIRYLMSRHISTRKMR